MTTQDPISLAGGVNLYQYTPNAIDWVDPFGLIPCPSRAERQARINELAEANAHRRLQEIESASSRSHSLERHGSQTTLQAQYGRVAHGINLQPVQHSALLQQQHVLLATVTY